MAKQKTFRFDEDTEKKLRDLMDIYNVQSENQCLKQIIDDIYKLKRSKALVPFEELDKRDKELKQAFFELGRLKQSVDEKDKKIDELKNNIEIQKEEKKNKKGFWAKLFGL